MAAGSLEQGFLPAGDGDSRVGPEAGSFDSGSLADSCETSWKNLPSGWHSELLFAPDASDESERACSSGPGLLPAGTESSGIGQGPGSPGNSYSCRAHSMVLEGGYDSGPDSMNCSGFASGIPELRLVFAALGSCDTGLVGSRHLRLVPVETRRLEVNSGEALTTPAALAIPSPRHGQLIWTSGVVFGLALAPEP